MHLNKKKKEKKGKMAARGGEPHREGRSAGVEEAASRIGRGRGRPGAAEEAAGGVGHGAARGGRRVEEDRGRRRGVRRGGDRGWRSALLSSLYMVE